jgi:hypothetical protein
LTLLAVAVLIDTVIHQCHQTPQRAGAGQRLLGVAVRRASVGRAEQHLTVEPAWDEVKRFAQDFLERLVPKDASKIKS